MSINGINGIGSTSTSSNEIRPEDVAFALKCQQLVLSSIWQVGSAPIRPDAKGSFQVTLSRAFQKTGEASVTRLEVTVRGEAKNGNITLNDRDLQVAWYAGRAEKVLDPHVILANVFAKSAEKMGVRGWSVSPATVQFAGANKNARDFTATATNTDGRTAQVKGTFNAASSDFLLLGLFFARGHLYEDGAIHLQ